MSSYFEKNNNDFIEANKILFELEFLKHNFNDDAASLETNFIGNFKNLDFKIIEKLITGIELIK